jgi:hypothetical protein
MFLVKKAENLVLEILFLKGSEKVRVFIGRARTIFKPRGIQCVSCVPGLVSIDLPFSSTQRVQEVKSYSGQALFLTISHPIAM